MCKGNYRRHLWCLCSLETFRRTHGRAENCLVSFCRHTQYGIMGCKQKTGVVVIKVHLQKIFCHHGGPEMLADKYFLQRYANNVKAAATI
jgi:hypothetical protein